MTSRRRKWSSLRRRRMQRLLRPLEHSLGVYRCWRRSLGVTRRRERKRRRKRSQWMWMRRRPWRDVWRVRSQESSARSPEQWRWIYRRRNKRRRRRRRLKMPSGAAWTRQRWRSMSDKRWKSTAGLLRRHQRWRWINNRRRQRRGACTLTSQHWKEQESSLGTFPRCPAWAAWTRRRFPGRSGKRRGQESRRRRRRGSGGHGRHHRNQFSGPFRSQTTSQTKRFSRRARSRRTRRRQPSLQQTSRSVFRLCPNSPSLCVRTRACHRCKRSYQTTTKQPNTGHHSHPRGAADGSPRHRSSTGTAASRRGRPMCLAASRTTTRRFETAACISGTRSRARRPSARATGRCRRGFPRSDRQRRCKPHDAATTTQSAVSSGDRL